MSEKNRKWIPRINQELATAHEARAAGNEGQARVCARRAAGFTIQEYFQERDIHKPNLTAYEHIQVFKTLPDIPEPIRQIADHLTTRVNEDTTLPFEADLIAEAEILIRFLYPEEFGGTR